MCTSPLLPFERFPPVPKGTDQEWLLCTPKARGLDLFTCVLTYSVSDGSRVKHSSAAAAHTWLHEKLALQLLSSASHGRAHTRGATS